MFTVRSYRQQKKGIIWNELLFQNNNYNPDTNRERNFRISENWFKLDILKFQYN